MNVGDIVLMADEQVTRIPVEDCGESLVDLGRCPFLAIDHRLSDPDGDWRQIRSGVADRLEQAALDLPSGLWFLVTEAYRPPELQSHYFSIYRDRLACARPDLRPAELHRLASRYVSPPEIAPHSAGAAIDLTLCAVDGVELDMGTPVDATPEESDDACYTHSPAIGAAARANREVLIAALTSAGFVNYPTEWWHWSYGDRYWALETGSSTAVYGPAARGPESTARR